MKLGTIYGKYYVLNLYEHTSNNNVYIFLTGMIGFKFKFTIEVNINILLLYNRHCIGACTSGVPKYLFGGCVV